MRRWSERDLTVSGYQPIPSEDGDLNLSIDHAGRVYWKGLHIDTLPPASTVNGMQARGRVLLQLNVRCARLDAMESKPGLITILHRGEHDGHVGLYRCNQRPVAGASPVLAEWVLAIGLQEGRLEIECFAGAAIALDLLRARGFSTRASGWSTAGQMLSPEAEEAAFLEVLANRGLDGRELAELLDAGLPIDTFQMTRFMTTSETGGVFWKGQAIATVPLLNGDVDQRQLRQVAGKCLLLERKGLPVDFRTIGAAMLALPEGSPWVDSMIAVESIWLRDTPEAVQVAALFGIGLGAERYYVGLVAPDPHRRELGMTRFEAPDSREVMARLAGAGFKFRASKALTSCDVMTRYLSAIDSDPSSVASVLAAESGVMNEEAETSIEMKFGS